MSIQLKDTATARRIEEMAAYYNLVPKQMRVLNHGEGVAWTKNKCQVNFHETKRELKHNFVGFSYDGQAKAAYQLALNILHDKNAQQKIGIEL